MTSYKSAIAQVLRRADGFAHETVDKYRERQVKAHLSANPRPTPRSAKERREGVRVSSEFTTSVTLIQASWRCHPLVRPEVGDAALETLRGKG